ncbi:MAG: hypothetical protein Q4F21_09160 [Lachnospiraceae bacterium]|nr:hypothetical protein [Lachnospiraceae bacterium]
MDKKKKKIHSMVSGILIVMLFMGSISMAAPTRVTLFLDKNQVWSTRYSATRSLKYSTVEARCITVYPIDGSKDTFTRIQVVVENSAGTDISNVETLYETSTIALPIKIKETYMNTRNVYFRFRGNHPSYAANAVVTYDGK